MQLSTRNEGIRAEDIRRAPQTGNKWTRFNIKKPHYRSSEAYNMLALPIFPGSHPPSIVGADVLNFCVRDGLNPLAPPRADAASGLSVQRSVCNEGARAKAHTGYRKRKQVDRPPFKELISKRKSPDPKIRACVRITYLPGQSPAKYCRRT